MLAATGAGVLASAWPLKKVCAAAEELYRAHNSFIPQANRVHSAPEMGPGWNTEIYEFLRIHPYVGFVINGKPIAGIYGETNGHPSVIEIESLETVVHAGKQVWSRDPLTVPAFTVPPATVEPHYPGNGLFIHNDTLRRFGVYNGVYEGSDGTRYIGFEGYNRKDTHPIGLTRYPLDPNNPSDRLVFLKGRQQGSIVMPDFNEPFVEFRCVWAGIMPAEKGVEMVYGNKEPAALFLTSCYPPEDWRSDNPPGRTVMKLERA